VESSLLEGNVPPKRDWLSGITLTTRQYGTHTK